MRTVTITRPDTSDIVFNIYLRTLAPHLIEEQRSRIEIINITLKGSQVIAIEDMLVVKSCCPQYHNDDQLDLPY